MTQTSVDPLEEFELLGSELLEGLRVETFEVTGRGFDKQRDEYHETTSTITSEEEFISCPAIFVTNLETGEEIDAADAQELLNELHSGERTDYDTAEYEGPDGYTYEVTYDMSPVEDFASNA